MATKTTKTAAKTAAKATKKLENHANDAFAAADDVTDAARDQFGQMMSAMTDNAESFRAQSEEMMESVRENFEATQERMSTVNSEIVSAARQEMAEAVDFVSELGRAKTVADALELQRDYWTNLFETRIERTRRLTEETTQAARDAFEPLNHSMASFGSTDAFSKFFPFATTQNAK